MSNINTYALPQMRGILGTSGTNLDSAYLPFLRQAVYDADRVLKQGMAVTVTGSSYALTPAPTATSTFWNTLAWGGVWLLRRREYEDFLNQLQGMASVKDAISGFSRIETMRMKKQIVDEAKVEFDGSLFVYSFSLSATALDITEMGFRETTLSEDDE